MAEKQKQKHKLKSKKVKKPKKNWRSGKWEKIWLNGNNRPGKNLKKKTHRQTDIQVPCWLSIKPFKSPKSFFVFFFVFFLSRKIT